MRLFHVPTLIFTVLLCSIPGFSQVTYISNALAQPIDNGKLIVNFSVNDSPERKVDKVNIVIGGKTVEEITIDKRRLFSFELALEAARSAKNMLYLDPYSGGERLNGVRLDISPDAIASSQLVSTESSSKPARPGDENGGNERAESSVGTAVAKVADNDDLPKVRLDTIGNVSTFRHRIARIVPGKLPEGVTKYVVYRGAGKYEHTKVPIPADGDKSVRVDLELDPGPNVYSVGLLREKANGEAELVKVAENEITITCEQPCPVQGSSFNTRAVIAFQQAGASSARSSAKPFIDLYFSVPIGGRRKVSSNGTFKQRDPRFSIWTDFRLTATTVQSFAELGGVSTNLLNPVFAGGEFANDIVQTFQANAGIEYRIFNESDIHSFLMPARTSLSFIAGGGVSNPLQSSDNVQVLKIPTLPNSTTIDPKFVALFEERFDFTGKTDVAFVNSERDRFFRRWFAGMRLKTSLWDDDETRSYVAPAMFDLTFGQDEAITKKLTNKVLTLDAFTPFPIRKADFIYLFGGVTMRLTRKVEERVPPFFFQSSTITDLADPSLIVIPIDESPFTRSGRDTYRFGIGVDLIRLFTREKTRAVATAK